MEEENRRLKRLVADLALDNAALKDVLSKTGEARSDARRCPTWKNQWHLNERCSCGLAQAGRTLVRYKPRTREDDDLRQWLRELAALRKRFGYRRLGLLLRR